MSRRLSPELEAAIWTESFRPVVLVRLDWPGGPIGFHSRTGLFPWLGATWHGVGGIGRISDLSEAPGLTVQETTLEIVAPPSQWDAIARARVRNRPAAIWLGGMDEAQTGLIADPLCVYEGEMRALAIKISPKGGGSLEGRVQLTLQGLLATVRRLKLRREDDPYLAYLLEQVLKWPA